MTLFRQQAIDHATRRLAGDVVIHTSAPRMAATAAALALVAFLGTMAATTSYARKETVRGQLSPTAGLIHLTVRQAGVVTAIHIAEGDEVVAGQPIATIRASATIASGDSYDRMAESLAAQTDAAEQLAASRRAGLDAEAGRQQARRRVLVLELAESRERARLAVENVALAQSANQRAEHLLREGALSPREFELQRSALLGAQTEASTARADGLRLEREIGEIDAALAALPISAAEGAAEAASMRATLQTQRTEAEAAATQTVVAEISGRVAALPIHVGDAVRGGETAAVLTPADAVLEAELIVPTRAAGFLEVGQPVGIMYDAYPHQKFGVGRGLIRAVSRTAVPAEEDVGQAAEPVFIVRVTLDADHVSAYGRDVALQPGLMLAADIILDRRSLLEWVLDPIFALQRGRQ